MQGTWRGQYGLQAIARTRRPRENLGPYTHGERQGLPGPQHRPQGWLCDHFGSYFSNKLQSDLPLDVLPRCN